MTSLLRRLRRKLPELHELAAPEGALVVPPPAIACIRQAGTHGSELFVSDGEVQLVIPLRTRSSLLLLIEQACAGLRRLHETHVPPPA